MKQIVKSKNQAYLMIFLGWLVYAMSYLGRVNYSANITQIIDFYGVTKAQAGTVPTFFFFAYGIGQVVNGLLCKKYNVKWFVFGSLLTSASINLLIAVGADFSLIKWLWMLNGIVLSVLWPTLIRWISEHLPQKALGTSAFAMGTTVATGTLIIYGLSSLYAMWHQFLLSFYTAALVMYVVAIVWLIFYGKAVSSAQQAKESEDVVTEVKQEKTVLPVQTSAAKKCLYLTICVLCFFAVSINLIKDGLTTWVPSILKEEFHMSDSISILLTLLLPMLAFFGNTLALKLHKMFSDYVNQCAVVFAVVAFFIALIIGSLKLGLMVVMFLGLLVVNCFIASLNNLVTSIFPLFMRGKVNSGLFAGIINGCCYVGSTLSAYGLGAIADHFGWTSVFWTLAGCCVIIFAVWFVYTLLKRAWQEKH